MTSKELDALIAVRVMGWIRPAETNPRLIEAYGTDQWLPAWGGFAPGKQGIQAIPNYSTSIADAWLIVEHMNSIPMGSDEGYQHVAPWVFAFQGIPFWELTAAQAALAICHTALRAVGAE